MQCGHDNLHQPKSTRVQASIALEIPIAVGRTDGANLCKRSVKLMFANPYERSSVALGLRTGGTPFQIVDDKSRLLITRVPSRCVGGGRYASRTCAEDCVGVGRFTVFGHHLSRNRRFSDPAHSDTEDTMMMGLYVTLGIFLLIAVRNPAAHRSLIAFAAWSSFAHGVVMSVLGFEIASERVGFLVGSALLVAIGIALIVLAPGK